MAQGTEWVPHPLTFQEQGLRRDDPPEPTPIYLHTPGPESVQMLLAQGDPPICPSLHPRPPRPPPEHPRKTKRPRGRLGRMTAQRHQRPRPLRRRHRTLPPSPGRSIPADGRTCPHHHHRQHESRHNPADGGGQPTPQDHAVRNTIGMLGLADLTANLEGQPSHFPHQTESAPSRIDV